MNTLSVCSSGVFGHADETEFVSVIAGDSVLLHTDHTAVMDDDLIQWWFKNTLIAEISVEAGNATVNDHYDWRFKDKLKVNRRTKCLTIRNITTEHAGEYERQSYRMRRIFRLTVIGELNISFS